MKNIIILTFFVFCFGLVQAEKDEYFITVINKCGFRTNSIDINKDNTQMIIGGENEIVLVYDLIKKKEKYQVKAHYQPVIHVQYSKEENSFFTVGDRSFKRWRIDDEEPEVIYTGTHTSITSWDLTPKEDYFIASSYDKKFRCWKSNQEKEIKTVETKHKKNIIAVAVSNNKKLIASGALDTSIEIWHVDSTIRKQLILGHTRPISCLQFMNNDQYLISASHDGYIKLWNVDTGDLIKIFEGHTKPISSIEISPDRKHLLTASYDNTIKLFSFSSGKCIHTYNYHQQPVLDIVWKNEGNAFYSCDKEGQIVEWVVPKRIFVEYYYSKELNGEIQESRLFSPRRKNESKDDFKKRQIRAEEYKQKLIDKYYLEYQQLPVLGN